MLIRNFNSNSAIDVVEEFRVIGLCIAANTTNTPITISFNAALEDGSSLSTTTATSSTEVILPGKSMMFTYDRTSTPVKVRMVEPSIDTLDASKITSGTLANSRTTATPSNTADAIISRDAEGDYSAGQANLTSVNVSYSGGPSATRPITISSSNTQGGTGFTEFIQLTSTVSGTSNPNKYLRMNNVGSLEIINSAYSATLLQLTNDGDLSATGKILAGSTSGNSFAPVKSILTSTNAQAFSMDNLNLRFNNGTFEVSPVSGSFGAMAEMAKLQYGKAPEHDTLSPTTINAGVWYSLSNGLTTVGNQASGVIHDYNNNLTYRVTCIVRAVSPNWNAFLIIEKLS